MCTALLVAFLSAQSADAATTAWRLQNPHLFREGNRLLAPSGTAGILSLKAGYTVSVSLGAWKLHRHRPKLAAALLVIGTVPAAAAAIHNARLR
jgi:hypothetical protein